MSTAQSKQSVTSQRPQRSHGGWRWTQGLAALPAALALVAGAVLLLLMTGNAARLSPAALERRAVHNVDRGASADAAIDYRRLLQQSPGEARYREGLQSALGRGNSEAAP